MEASDFTTALHNNVTKSYKVDDIMKLLGFVNFDDLQEFVHDQIDKMESDHLRSAYHWFVPINSVLPADVMQHILSFGHFDEKFKNRVVCKQWNRLYKLNQEIMLRAVYQPVIDKYPEPLSPNNHTWILHEVRTLLHPMEQHLGYRGPINDLKDIATVCKSGDRVLVHKKVRDRGVFRWYLYEYPRYLDKGIHLIGLSPVERGRSEIEILSRVVAHVTMDNLKVIVRRLPIGGHAPDELHLMPRPGKLTIRNCEVVSDVDSEVDFGIMVDCKGSLDMEHCHLGGFGYQGVLISPFANKVKICDNTIKWFNRGIVIKQSLQGPRFDIFDLADIRIMNNVFEELEDEELEDAALPVVEITNYNQQEPIIKGTGRCVLCGNTRLECTESLDRPDANTLFHLRETSRSTSVTP